MITFVAFWYRYTNETTYESGTYQEEGFGNLLVDFPGDPLDLLQLVKLSDFVAEEWQRQNLWTYRPHVTIINWKTETS